MFAEAEIKLHHIIHFIYIQKGQIDLYCAQAIFEIPFLISFFSLSLSLFSVIFKARKKNNGKISCRFLYSS